MEKTIHKITPALLEETVTLEVDIQPTSKIHEWLQNKKWVPSKRIFKIAPIKMGTLIKISGILCKMDIDILKSKDLLDDYYNVVAKEGRNISLVIALAVVNRKSNPSKRLVNFILRNFKAKDLVNTLQVVINQMDITSFINSMVLIGKMNLHKTSPAEQGSQIAPGELSAE